MKDKTLRKCKLVYVRLEVFTAMTIHVMSFWVVTLCGDVVGYQ